jgi:predicted transcriptional regulator
MPTIIDTVPALRRLRRGLARDLEWLRESGVAEDWKIEDTEARLAEVDELLARAREGRVVTVARVG